MKISIILGHPNPESFNFAVAEKARETLLKNGHEIYFHDLYQERFDPVITGHELSQDDVTFNPLVHKHCREITSVDGIIIVHPNWWGQPPAILKGWIDRVMRPGVAYLFGEDDDGSGIPDGLLKARSAIVFNTSNTAGERENNLFLDPLETLWKNCVFHFCGVDNFYRKMFRIVAGSTPEQRQEWLSEVEKIICDFYPAV